MLTLLCHSLHHNFQNHLRSLKCPIASGIYMHKVGLLLLLVVWLTCFKLGLSKIAGAFVSYIIVTTNSPSHHHPAMGLPASYNSVFFGRRNFSPACPTYVIQPTLIPNCALTWSRELHTRKKFKKTNTISLAIPDCCLAAERISMCKAEGEETGGVGNNFSC